MSLLTEDLVKGEIYHCLYNDKIYIFKFIKDEINSTVCATRFFQNSWSFWKSASKLQKASNLEVNWLEKCIQANKFIPLSEIKETPINILNNLELW